jgi:hypothetical protein
MTDCKHGQKHLTKRTREGSPEDENERYKTEYNILKHIKFILDLAATHTEKLHRLGQERGYRIHMYYAKTNTQ